MLVIKEPEPKKPLLAYRDPSVRGIKGQNQENTGQTIEILAQGPD